ncbi:MAG: formylglycine-generating enzyme family protein [Bacteroidaceae bacterium]|nr:formylglycine-generating enzyme family protein [Bacteroidaceae bacterium]
MKNKYFFSFLLAMLMALPSTAQVRQLQVWRGGAIVQSFATTQIDSVTFSVISEPGTGGSASEPKVYTVNGVSFKMIPVEGGAFIMGATAEQGTDVCENEEPTHPVRLSSYAIGETEVTQELWKAVMGTNPSYFSGNQLPVEQVSWNDCQTFITKLNQLTGANFRLPTEAEWEFAARGGNKSLGYRYAGSNIIRAVAWFENNSISKSHAVAQKQPNELGLYDMSGNVNEWCQDWYGLYGSAAQTDPTGPVTGSDRVMRGGDNASAASFCRLSYRLSYDPACRTGLIGLRLALPNLQ